YFMRSEDQRRGPSDWHGVGGPLSVEDPRDRFPASVAFADTLARCSGVPRVDDFNRGESEGAGLYQLTCRDGVRCSAAAAFLVPALKRKNLTVVRDALALGLVASGSRITGVRYGVGNTETVAHASREVVLSAGAVGSPHLLMLSGIGPAAHLRD